MSNDDIPRRLDRLEDKFHLYEPVFTSLHTITSVPADIDKIQVDLQRLKESRITVKEQLITLFKAQDRVYQDLVKSLEKQTRVLEKKMADCPIQDVVTKINLVDKKVLLIELLETKVVAMEKILDSFKLKGWDLLFRSIPWVIAFSAAIYAFLKSASK